MYRYVEDKKFLKQAERKCSSIMRELEHELRKEGMNTQFALVGSGGRNMVTQNGRGKIDFDYNLTILSFEKSYDLKKIKKLIIKCFNKVMRKKGLRDVNDSTSCLTTKNISLDDKRDDFVDKRNKKYFSMDVCVIIRNNDGTWNRLIHEKNGQNDRYYWNTAPNVNAINKKANKIKNAKEWELVRDEYLKIKNKYLSKQQEKPSYICYIEAVNNVYNILKQQSIL